MRSSTREMALLLLSLADEAGGRVDPNRITRRPYDAPSRLAFDLCLRERWIGGDGWLQPLGRVALDDWRGLRDAREDA